MKKTKKVLLKTSLGSSENSTLVIGIYDHLNDEVIVGHFDYSST